VGQPRKIVRAEPVAALYEQNKIHHVGTFATLEDQMCGFTSDFDRATAGYSPDRVDALVWALTDLLVEPMANSGVFELYREQARQLALEQCQARTEAGVCARQPRVRETTAGRGEHLAHAFWFARKEQHCRIAGCGKAKHDQIDHLVLLQILHCPKRPPVT